MQLEAAGQAKAAKDAASAARASMAGGKRLWSGSKMFFLNVATSYGFWTINHMGTFFVDG